MLLLALSKSLEHDFMIKQHTINLIVLFIVFIKMTVYFVIENLVAYRYCKFMILPWLVYGIYLLDLIAHPSVARDDDSDQQNISFINGNSVLYSTHKYLRQPNTITNNINSLKINLTFFFQICLFAYFIFLFISKIVKFIWNEFFYSKKFLSNF
jgi:hypothetical protein